MTNTLSNIISRLPALNRFHKFFLHKNGLTLLIMVATMKKPYYYLHWWAYFCLVMSIFFIYILTIRDEIKPVCDPSFWSNPSKDNIMKEYIQEYACVTNDRRFFQPDSYVYWAILWNVVLVPFLLYFLLTADRKIKSILILQAIPTLVYLLSMSWTFSVSFKSVLYILISSIWFIYPVMVYISLKNK